jgi:hypothetical protein
MTKQSFFFLIALKHLLYGKEKKNMIAYQKENISNLSEKN